jgi:hypothetical protein
MQYGPAKGDGESTRYRLPHAAPNSKVRLFMAQALKECYRVMRLILSAGMPRSGSTWLYNAARLLIKGSFGSKNNFSCGWIGDWNDIPKKEFTLIKIHDFDEQIVTKASTILYSYRDIRDAMASSFRKFKNPPTIEKANNLINMHSKWVEVTDFIMRYEDMLHNKMKIIDDLKKLFHIDFELPSIDIIKNIDMLNYDCDGKKNVVYHEVNLFHKDHITCGEWGSWGKQIDQDIIKEIENRYRQWFVDNNYPLTHK